MAEEPIRLGGMALANGVLVHGPNAWACAIRLPDGRLEVASDFKRYRSSGVTNPLLRGPARLAEGIALLPQVRRRLPGAKLPFERPRVLTSMIAGAAVTQFAQRFQRRFNYKPDHNGIKGYTAVYAVKYVTEKKLGKFDRKAFAKTMHGLTITPQDEPGILMETTWDNVGEIDRISFLAEVVNGKQSISKVLPKLGK